VRRLGSIAEAVIDDLVRREALADAHVRVSDLAVLDDSAAHPWASPPAAALSGQVETR